MIFKQYYLGYLAQASYLIALADSKAEKKRGDTTRYQRHTGQELGLGEVFL